MEDFLSALLPRTGVYYAVVVHPEEANKRPTHYACHSIPELAKNIAELDRTGLTVYHACAAFKQDVYFRWSDKYRKDLPHWREADNVKAVRAFYLDLDIYHPGFNPEKPKERHWYHFNDKAEAVKALISLCKTEKLPTPTVIDSGGGFHIYWMFEDEMLPMTWVPLAEGFKDALFAAKFKTDPTVPADISRILRTPGAHNRKFEQPLPVRQVGSIRVHTNALILEALNRFTKKYKVTPKLLKQAFTKYTPDPNEANFLAHEEYLDSYIEDIAPRCAVVSDMRETRGNVSEPIWYGVMGMMALTKDGRPDLIHEWSKGYPGYSAMETDEKADQWLERTTGAPTCAYFRSKGAKQCATCPLWGIIKSPISLGRRLAEKENINPATGEEIVPPPSGFLRADDGIYVVVDATAGINRKVYSSDLFISEIVKHQSGYEVAVVNYDRPHMGWQQFHERTSLYNKLDTAWASFSDHGIYIANKGEAEIMAQYCRGYLEELHRRKQALITYTNMGWKNDDTEFVVGSTVVTKDGFTKNRTIQQAISIAGYFDPKGSIKTWIDTTELLNHSALRIHGFSLLLGFASPLYKFTGFGGATFNIVGETGYGKSSIQRMVLSIYGDPVSLLMTAKDTQNGVIKRLSTLNNLPACIDEVGNISPERASNLILQVTQGVDKLSLSQNREERIPDAWSLVAQMSSNHPLSQKFSVLKADHDAETMRLMEITLPMDISNPFLDKALTKRFNRTINENYGQVGLLYLKRLAGLGGAKEIQLLLDEGEAELALAGIEFTAQERYWSALFTTAYTAGKIAAQHGLIKFDIMASIHAAYAALGKYKETVSENKLDAYKIVGNFIADHYSQFIITERSANGDFLTKNNPITREICGRIERNPFQKTVTCSINIGVLRGWLGKQYMSISKIKDGMPLGGILKDSASISLGRGTNYQLPATKCMVFDLTDPCFGLSFDGKAQLREVVNG